jgi:hypothetical protein
MTSCGGDKSSAGKDPAAAAVAPGALPPLGRHFYDTRGYERVHAVLTSRLSYPRRSTVTYRRAGCGFSERWAAGTRRSTTSQYCLEGGGRRLRGLVDAHGYAGQPFELRYTCTGPVVPPPRRLRPGSAWTDRCRALDASVLAPQRVVGIERIANGGRRVETAHLRVQAVFRGVIRGASTIDSWVRRRDGLLVRRVVRSDSRVRSPIGTVGARERYEIALSG